MAFPAKSAGITIHGDTYPFITPARYSTALSGKVVLVTGASRGIGRHTALAFAKAGAHVALLARSSSAIEALASEIKTQYKVPVLTITSDVLSDAAGIISQVEKGLGPVDILINNAGKNRVIRFADETDFASWWDVFEVNTRAPLALIHALIPTFRARGNGTVITVGSAVADGPVPFLGPYVGSKAAVQKTVQIIDLELKTLGIQNFVIHPGANISDLSTKEESVKSEEMKQYLAAFHPYMTDTLDLASDSMVALAGLAQEGKVGFLSGRYWDVTEDLEELIKKGDEIESGDLYNLRLRKLI